MTARNRRAGILGATVVVVAAAGAVGVGIYDAQSTGGPRCEPFTFTHNGIPWKASAVRTVDLSCEEATSVIKLYAKPRNCQFLPSCGVGSFSCRTLSSEGSNFTEDCTRGHESVRWRGSYVSS